MSLLNNSKLFANEQKKKIALELLKDLPQDKLKDLPVQSQALLTKIVRHENNLHESLLDFIPRTTPRWERPEHLWRIADLFERIKRGEKVRALVSVPPRHGKTELVLHAIAWLLRDAPHETIAYTSYGASFAASKSMLARNYAIAAGVQLSGDKNTLAEWRTIELGGLLATGVGGPLNGQGCQTLIVDDPFKSRAEAESPVMRDFVYNWYTSTASTRVEPGGSRIVVHTRWHQDDLIGRLSQEKDGPYPYEVISLPAIDPQGNALWPSRWPLSELAEKRATNEYDWFSLFMQDPRPRGGKVFRTDPVRFTAVPGDGRLVLSVDAAGTESTASDFTVAIAMLVSGRGAQQQAYILDVRREQTTPEQSAFWLYEFQKLHGNHRIMIERSRDGVAIAKVLKKIERKLRIKMVAPIGDKFIRAQPVATAWNQSRVFLPAHAPWLTAFLYEIEKFTGIGGGGKDDQVDALSQGWNSAFSGAAFTSDDDLD